MGEHRNCSQLGNAALPRSVLERTAMGQCLRFFGYGTNHLLFLVGRGAVLCWRQAMEQAVISQ